MRTSRFLALAAFLTLIASREPARAQAEEEDQESQPSDDAPQAEPSPAAKDIVAEAPAPPSPPPFLMHFGPDTFPGRLRGIYGGSLWLEPDFQGLQWPQNPRTSLGVSAKFWVDDGYETIVRGSDQLPNSNLIFQQGRSVLRFTPAYVRDRLFVQGQVELVGNLCQTTNSVCSNTGTFTTDDLWIRVGEWNSWDVQAGRFEAWEIYHLGMGMEPYTLERLGAGMFGVTSLATPALEAPTFYGVTYLHDRPTDGFAVGYVALHLYPADFLRFELLAKLGDDNYRVDNSTGDTPANYLGGRPTAIFDVGWFKLRVGGEYEQRTPTTQTIEPGTPGHKKDAVARTVLKGAGASFQIVIDPFIEFGLNAAIGSQSEKDGFGMEVPEATFTTKSVGGFANLRLDSLWLLGVGANWTTQTDAYLATNSTANDFTAQLQCFAALQYLLMGQLYIKTVVGFARAEFLPSDLTVSQWNNDMYSARVRLMYLY